MEPGPPLRILQLAAEVTPFAKTGGLGDVVAGLSRFLGRAGHDVRIFLPFYPSLAAERERYTPVEALGGVPVRLGSQEYTFTGRTALLPDSDLQVIFIDCPALFGEGGVYHGDRQDSLRFPLLSVAALESARRLGWAPDVLHCHDWHTALTPLLLETRFQGDPLFARTRTVLTLHNLAFQGIVYPKRLFDLGLEPYQHLLDLAGMRLNFLKNGILHADALTTVSRTYAREIQEPEHGLGLEELLRSRSSHLVGIVNGVDDGEWDPAADPHLRTPYSAADFSGKQSCKQALLREAGFDEHAAAPVAAVVSRMTPQKGLDLCSEVLPAFLDRGDLRLVALGSGEPRCEELFHALARRFPGKAWYRRDYSEGLAHRIEAGADLFLMPSRFEPCGLNQMYSLRYGTPPVVRRTGGLADTVEPFEPATGQGTGFVFEPFTPHALGGALGLALETYRDRPTWERLMIRGMTRDFSWDVQGREYAELYRRLAE